jgi:hypothetical protein
MHQRCAPRPLFFLFPRTVNRVFIFLSSRTMLADVSSSSFSHVGQFTRFETILSPRTIYLCMKFLLVDNFVLRGQDDRPRRTTECISYGWGRCYWLFVFLFLFSNGGQCERLKRHSLCTNVVTNAPRKNYTYDQGRVST